MDRIPPHSHDDDWSGIVVIFLFFALFVSAGYVATHPYWPERLPNNYYQRSQPCLPPGGQNGYV